MSEILVKLENVKAPKPIMHKDAAARYNELRKSVVKVAGFDFLAVCGDIFRDAGFVSNKDGVANRSWHKTGRAFDYNQEEKNLLIASDVINGKQYFRTYLKTNSSSLGEIKTVKDFRGFIYQGRVFDFTAAAEARGFKCIPAWNGWQRKRIRAEFWHYQFDEGKTWDAAMLELRGKARAESQAVLGLNDRGEIVRELQQQLNRKGLLAAWEIDGVFGIKTLAAVKEFQKRSGLTADGLVGSKTRALLNK